MSGERSFDVRKPEPGAATEAINLVRGRRLLALSRFAVTAAGVGSVFLIAVGAAHADPFMIALGFMGLFGASNLMVIVGRAAREDKN